MENPILTFVTPSLIAGDKSLSFLIDHEISHSWSGNLVTMDNLSDFWLNEGFTMFLQRKITEYTFDSDTAKLDAMVLNSELSADIISFGESKSFTQLRPYLIGRNPCEAFSKVPYEKVFNLIKFKYSSINSEGLKLFLLEK